MESAKIKSLLVTPDATIKQVMQKLGETQERIVFVVDGNDRVLGTVNDGDIRRAIAKGLGFNDAVEKIMRRNFVSVRHGSSTPEQISKIMVETKIQQIPVLDDAGAIVDVVLWTDLLEGKKHPQPRKLHSQQVVIMAGGKGTRLDPFTKILPKPLIPVGNKTVIELIMDNFHRYGFHKFIFTLNYKKEYIKMFLRENEFPYTIDWVEEEDFLGTAGSLSLLKDKIADTFFVINCDSIMDVNLESILDWHAEQKAAMTIVGCYNEFKIPFGVLELSDGKLERITEKPVHDVIINTGVYVMEPRIISYIPDGKAANMNEVIERVLATKEKVSVYPIYGGWFDIGQWKEYRDSLRKLEGLEDV